MQNISHNLLCSPGYWTPTDEGAMRQQLFTQCGHGRRRLHDHVRGVIPISDLDEALSVPASTGSLRSTRTRRAHSSSLPQAASLSQMVAVPPETDFDGDMSGDQASVEDATEAAMRSATALKELWPEGEDEQDGEEDRGLGVGSTQCGLITPTVRGLFGNLGIQNSRTNQSESSEGIGAFDQESPIATPGPNIFPALGGLMRLPCPKAPISSEGSDSFVFE